LQIEKNEAKFYPNRRWRCSFETKIQKNLGDGAATSTWGKGAHLKLELKEA